MKKYSIQVLYISYIDIDAEHEIEAKADAKMLIQERLEEKPLTIEDLTFTVTND